MPAIPPIVCYSKTPTQGLFTYANNVSNELGIGSRIQICHDLPAGMTAILLNPVVPDQSKSEMMDNTPLIRLAKPELTTTSSPQSAVGNRVTQNRNRHAHTIRAFTGSVPVHHVALGLSELAFFYHSPMHMSGKSPADVMASEGAMQSGNLVSNHGQVESTQQVAEFYLHFWALKGEVAFEVKPTKSYKRIEPIEPEQVVFPYSPEAVSSNRLTTLARIVGQSIHLAPSHNEVYLRTKDEQFAFWSYPILDSDHCFLVIQAMAFT